MELHDIPNGFTGCEKRETGRERGREKKRRKNAGENYQGFSSPSWQKHNVVPKDMKIFNRE